MSDSGHDVDPTFYRSPADAIRAPPEQLAYVVAFDRAAQQPDALAVLGTDPASAGYGQVVGWADLPSRGNELHHFGWNACSSAFGHAGHDEIATLEMRVRRVRAQGRAARVPPEVVQLVSAGGQVGPADDLAVPVRRRVGVEYGERIRLLRGAVEDDHVGQLLGRGADGVRGAPVEGRVDVVAC